MKTIQLIQSFDYPNKSKIDFAFLIDPSTYKPISFSQYAVTPSRQIPADDPAGLFEIRVAHTSAARCWIHICSSSRQHTGPIAELIGHHNASAG